MSDYNIVFTGTVEVGLQYAINAISDVPIVNATATLASAEHSDGSVPRAMDYGVLNLSKTERVHLYAMPDQIPDEQLWDHLQGAGLGLVLLLDNARDNAFADLSFYLRQYGDYIAGTAAAIGVTGLDKHASPTLEEYGEYLRIHHRNFPVFEADVNKQRDIAILVQALVYSLDPRACASG